MAWKKYFKDANLSPISGEKVPNFAKRNYSSYLPMFIQDIQTEFKDIFNMTKWIQTVKLMRH